MNGSGLSFISNVSGRKIFLQPKGLCCMKGLFGVADAVELHPVATGKRSVAELVASREFTIMPVEYKRGHRKISDCDRYQVVAQAMALEEMYGAEISRAAVFYWEDA